MNFALDDASVFQADVNKNELRLSADPIFQADVIKNELSLRFELTKTTPALKSRPKTKVHF